jgi:hypothetical protein
MDRVRQLLWLVMFVTATSASGAFAACTARSGPQTTSLVELFTSEGCSSCPPADRWLSANFRGKEARAVALAFQVDYWDRLGWKDRFARAAFTGRQYQAMRANGARFVYTPQVLVQGKPVEHWASRAGNDSALGAVLQASALPARADIAVEVAPRHDAIAVKAWARTAPPKDRRSAVLHVALAQSGLVSDVKTGENGGAHLAHDHVVRAFQTSAPADAAGMMTLDATLPVPADGATDSALVAFVQDVRTGDVLQALELPLSAASCAP